MRLRDVADQLRTFLPGYTTRFSTFIAFDSIVSDGSTATIVTTSDHNLATGRSVVFNGVALQNVLSDVTSPSLTEKAFETAADHDVNLDWPRDPTDRANVGTVLLAGFTGGDTDWNAEHPLETAVNRRNFSVKPNPNLTAPTLDGNQFILEIRFGGINGIHTVTVVNSTTFTVSGSIAAGTYQSGTISELPRVSVLVNAEDAKKRLSELHPDNEFELFIAPADVVTSKDRRENSDAIAAQASGTDVRLMILDGFGIIIKAPTTEELSGAEALDICRHDLRPALYNTLYGLKLDTGMASSADFKVIPTGDNTGVYNRAYLTYIYIWQFPFDVIEDDASPILAQSAFRDIDYTDEIGDGVSISDLDLDDEPL